MFKLFIEDDEGQSTQVPLNTNVVSIGRDESNGICLHERNVSRKHAEITIQDGNISIKDLDSYNGVLVNGERISNEQSISPGDLIQIGDFDLAVLSESQDSLQAIPSMPSMSGIEQTSLDSALDDIPTQITSLDESDLAEARLYVLNGAFAGQEYLLDKDQLTIGREDSNDIILNDGSISKHHAKISSVDEGFMIEDVGSVNGILLNGEEFRSGHLQFGDIIELGVIKLRLLAPNEAAPTLPSAKSLQSMDQMNAAGGLNAILLGGGAVAVILCLGLFWVFYNPNKSHKQKPQNNTSKQQAPKKETPEEKLAKAKKLFQENSYDEAVKQLKNLTENNPNLEAAKLLLTKVNKEKLHFEKLTKGATLFASGKIGDLQSAYKLLNNFAETSKHAPNAVALFNKVKEALVKSLYNKAKTLVEEKKYFTALQFNNQALEIDAENKDCKDLHKRLEKLTSDDPDGSQKASENQVDQK